MERTVAADSLDWCANSKYPAAPSAAVAKTRSTSIFRLASQRRARIKAGLVVSSGWSGWSGGSG
ncbi:MAG: hypothetical protein ACRD82_10535, partial [Blastocatellia bacterium]